MPSSNGELGKWNFWLDLHVRWERQPTIAAANGNEIQSQAQRLPADNPEGSVVYHFTDEAGTITCHTGTTCPECDGASFESVDALMTHIILSSALRLRYLSIF